MRSFALARSNNIQTRQKKDVTALVFCAVMGLLLVARVIYPPILYVAAAFGVLAVLFSNASNGLAVLLFTMPLGPIFKISPDQFSFFTVMFFVYVAKLALTRKIKLGTLLVFVLFLGYLLAFSGINQAINAVTMCMGIFMLWALSKQEINFRNVILCYTGGILLASVLSIFRLKSPVLMEFVKSTMHEVQEGVWTRRFSGLQGNPNYFTMDVIMASAGLAVLLLKEKHSLIYSILFGVITAIGVFSISNSYLISLVILMVLIFLASLRTDFSRFLKLCAVLAVGVIAVCLIDIEKVTIFLGRILALGESSLSSITTGRSDIWASYIIEILSDNTKLFFGHGLGYELVGEYAPHNTFIEIVHALGVIGGVFYLVLVLGGFKGARAKGGLICFAPLVVLLFRMVAIGLLVYDSIYFFLAIATLALRYVSPREAERGTRRNPVLIIRREGSEVTK